jgi:hypothetical protein
VSVELDVATLGPAELPEFFPRNPAAQVCASGSLSEKAIRIADMADALGLLRKHDERAMTL